jgi:hypothetical protein
MRLPKPNHRPTASQALPLSLALSLSLALGGCNGAFLGNFFVLGVTVAIFFGTLSLGRKSEASRADASAADGSRSAGPLNDA